MDDVAKSVDYCLGSKGSPFDVAHVVSKVFVNKYRYVGDKVWEYFDVDLGQWEVDKNLEKVYSAISIDVCQVFMDRAQYWQDQSQTTDISAKIDCQIRSQKILEVCLKLKKDPFIKSVLKEARAFLSID